ncbi:unnamed protein product [Pieris macdunnoughi]|uniref:DDE Tnp4 domain-containing protein n=1 Tax=Pieris macdunnoughi TaxID=345717 RepID=A0A821UIN5_9NEOP|nr:unnamed protein product [Pieris macdunnoughi]
MENILTSNPPNSGSLYFNYKKTFSVVLMALVDANYNFTIVNVGSYGKNSDGGIFANSNLGKELQRKNLSLPASYRPGSSTAPYVLVGDEAFPLKTYLMRPSCLHKRFVAAYDDLPAVGLNASIEAFYVSDTFKSYFISPAGAVPWQNNRI